MCIACAKVDRDRGPNARAAQVNSGSTAGTTATPPAQPSGNKVWRS